MKVCLITDSHFGARNDSVQFSEYFERFFNEVFWPYVDGKNIKHVIHLGDLVDRRKFINYNSYNVMRKCFLDKIDTMTIIPGNHDSYYKNTIEVNAVQEILKDSGNVTIVNSAQTLKFGSLEVLLVPWICEENSAQTLELIDKSNAPICMGHLELTGFKFNRIRVCEHGLTPNLFSKFNKVFSGHFHHRSSQGNIQYLGAPYEMTWEDWDDPKGFHIFDTDTLELEFIRNPLRMHEKIVYDTKLEDVDYSLYKNKYVKVLVKEKTDVQKFMNFVDKLENSGAYSVQIIESAYEFNSGDEATSEPTVIEDPITIMKNYVRDNDFPVSKDKLNSLFEDMYKKALSIES
jgi:DNA repair exonuclease SbcCD nuclease subunit